MPSWKKRILRIKDGKQTTNDDPQDEETSIRILDELSPPSEDDLKALKKGARVQFYHYIDNSTDGLWMEGTILQRIITGAKNILLSGYAQKTSKTFCQILDVFK